MNELSESLNNSQSQLIKSAFSDLEKNKEGKFTYEEIAQYMNKKSGKVFNNELLVEIFHSVDLTQESSITAEEFLSGYQKTEFMLTSQISKLKQQVSENISKLSKTQKSLVEARSNPANLENNIYLTIHSIQNLDHWVPSSKLAIQVICDGQEVVTAGKSFPDLVWNSSFTIPVSTGQGSINLNVWTWEYGKLKTRLYELSIPICALAKQELHEDTLALRAVDRAKESSAQVLLDIQWIYDLGIYLDGMVKDYEEEIKQDKNQLEILKNFLVELKTPAESFAVPDWYKQNQELCEVEKVISVQVQNLFEKVEFFKEKEMIGSTVKWGKVLLSTIFIFFFLSVLSCFDHPNGFNVFPT